MRLAPEVLAIRYVILFAVATIQEVYSWNSSIHLVIEDEYLDCERMSIDGFPEKSENYLTNRMFTVGDWIRINLSLLRFIR